jgi:hypothetical protein
MYFVQPIWVRSEGRFPGGGLDRVTHRHDGACASIGLSDPPGIAVFARTNVHDGRATWLNQFQ